MGINRFNSFGVDFRGRGRTRGAGGGGYSQFTFADDFTAGEEYLVNRDGWQVASLESRVIPNNTSGYLNFNDGYDSDTYANVDVGSVAANTAKAVISSAVGLAFINRLAVNICDDQNSIEFDVSHTGTRRYLRKIVDGVTTQLQLEVVATSAGAEMRLDWDWSSGSCVVQAYIDGVRWPNASTEWTIAASGGFMPSGRAGFSFTGRWSSFSAGQQEKAPWLTLNKMNRVYQDPASGDRDIAIGGTCGGVSSIECRLLQNDSVVTGWDWGETSLENVTISNGVWTATAPGIPLGENYRLNVRSVDDTTAQSASHLFCVGQIHVLWGQSLSTGALPGLGAATVAAETNIWYPTGNDTVSGARFNPVDFSKEWGFQGLGLHDSAYNGGGEDSVVGWFGKLLRDAGDTDGHALTNTGQGSTYLASFLPTETTPVSWGNGTDDTLWENFGRMLVFLGDDFASLHWSQGQEDAGRNEDTASFGSTEAAQYKTDFATLVAAVRTLTGRTAAQLPVFIHGLGRLDPGTGIGDYTADASWDLFRYTQYELTQEIDNCHLSHTQMDLALADSVHLTTAGYTADMARAARAWLEYQGTIAYDGKGPLPTTAVASGNDIVLTFDANGASAITCAAAVAANVCFFDDDTYASQQTPTSMSIGTLSAGNIAVTFTFSGTPSTAWRVTSGKGGANSTGGILPDVANALIGTYADGFNTITWPIWEPISVTT